MSTLIMKFGGTSVANADAIAQAAGIILKQTATGDGVVAVVSAMGGVTDALTRGVRAAAAGDKSLSRDVAAEILQRTREAAKDLVSSDEDRKAVLTAAEETMVGYLAVCESVHVLAEVTPRVLDRATSCGEPLVAALLAAHLRAQGGSAEAVNPGEVIVTDGTFQNAAPLLAETRARCAERLAPLIAEGTIPVVGGFIGATVDGVTTTLGRGGSEFSAAFLGQADQLVGLPRGQDPVLKRLVHVSEDHLELPPIAGRLYHLPKPNRRRASRIARRGPIGFLHPLSRPRGRSGFCWALVGPFLAGRPFAEKGEGRVSCCHTNHPKTTRLEGSRYAPPKSAGQCQSRRIGS